jgi:hypothetical protein
MTQTKEKATKAKTMKEKPGPGCFYFLAPFEDYMPDTKGARAVFSAVLAHGKADRLESLLHDRFAGWENPPKSAIDQLLETSKKDIYGTLGIPDDEDVAMEAVLTYLERQGFDPEVVPDGSFRVAYRDEDEGCIVLASVSVGIGSDEPPRDAFEAAALEYLGSNDGNDAWVRGDHLSVVYVGDKRAMVRTHKDAYRYDAEEGE